MKMTQDEKYMKAAIREAKKAYALDEVPIGCVIVQDGTIIARGYNRRNTEGNTLAHAELTAIKKASKKTGDWRLEDCTMYVTLEPCQMCAGAIVQSRMKKVVIATMNPKAGCAGSVLNLLQMAAFNHQVEIEKGVSEEECSTMLSDFFRELREKKKRKKTGFFWRGIFPRLIILRQAADLQGDALMPGKNAGNMSGWWSRRMGIRLCASARGNWLSTIAKEK